MENVRQNQNLSVEAKAKITRLEAECFRLKTDNEALSYELKSLRQALEVETKKSEALLGEASRRELEKSLLIGEVAKQHQASEAAMKTLFDENQRLIALNESMLKLLNPDRQMRQEDSQRLSPDAYEASTQLLRIKNSTHIENIKKELQEKLLKEDQAAAVRSASEKPLSEDLPL